MSIFIPSPARGGIYPFPLVGEGRGEGDIQSTKPRACAICPRYASKILRSVPAMLTVGFQPSSSQVLVIFGTRSCLIGPQISSEFSGSNSSSWQPLRAFPLLDYLASGRTKLGFDQDADLFEERGGQQAACAHDYTLIGDLYLLVAVLHHDGVFVDLLDA